MANDDEKAFPDPKSDSSADAGVLVACEEDGLHFARQAGDASLSGCSMEVTATNTAEVAAAAGDEVDVAKKLDVGIPAGEGGVGSMVQAMMNSGSPTGSNRADLPQMISALCSATGMTPCMLYHAIGRSIGPQVEAESQAVDGIPDESKAETPSTVTGIAGNGAASSETTLCPVASALVDSTPCRQP